MQLKKETRDEGNSVYEDREATRIMAVRSNVYVSKQAEQSRYMSGETKQRRNSVCVDQETGYKGSITYTRSKTYVFDWDLELRQLVGGRRVTRMGCGLHTGAVGHLERAKCVPKERANPRVQLWASTVRRLAHGHVRMIRIWKPLRGGRVRGFREGGVDCRG